MHKLVEVGLWTLGLITIIFVMYSVMTVQEAVIIP